MVKYRILLSVILMMSLSALTVYSQPCRISDGTLPFNYDRLKKLPIHGENNEFRVLIFDDTDETAREFIRDPDHQCEWYPGWENIGPAGQYSLEYYFSNTGVSYAYKIGRDSLYYWVWGLYDPGYFFGVDCPGRPVVDLLDNIHVIWEGTGDTVHYGFSTDTLNTFAVEQSVIPPGEFIYLASSPDHYYSAAIFYNDQEDAIYKYLAEPGEAFDLTGDPEIITCTTNLNRAFDITLDFESNICMVVNVPGDWYWGDHNYWSELHGYEFLRPSADDTQDGSNYQIAFGEDLSEILIIDNDFYGHTRFYCSLDGGNSWGISNYEMVEGLYTSTTRVFSDTIPIVFCSWHSTYYNPIDKDIIFDELTDIKNDGISEPRFLTLSNYPNPFNSSTTISFTLPEAGDVRLAVYDIRGRLVNRLIDENMDVGTHTVNWDGTDSDGESISSGVYFYSLIQAEKAISNRMILLK